MYKGEAMFKIQKSMLITGMFEEWAGWVVPFSACIENIYHIQCKLFHMLEELQLEARRIIIIIIIIIFFNVQGL